jgi:uncharacterized protein (DUF2336 family)
MTPQSLIDELEDALEQATPEKRSNVLWRITDLFISGVEVYAEDQITLFDDVIGRLVSTIESNARAKLANRLARVSCAPVNVIRMLSCDDDIAVARPVLRQSERLDDAHLVATASSKGQPHLMAIAERRALSEAVTEVLVERGDREVVRSVARNNGARFSNAAFRTLVDRSNNDDVLAVHVGTRGDLPRHHFLKLIERASATVRHKLAAADPRLAAAVREVVDEIGGNMRAAFRNSSPDYAVATAQVKALHGAGELGEPQVLGFADARKFEETAVALSLLAKVPIDLVERALLDDNPDLIVILAKVAGLSWGTAQSILVRASDRAMSVQDLDRALAGFSRLKPTTARSIIQFYDARRRAPASPLMAGAAAGA